MIRECAATKARRLLIEGRITVLGADEGTLAARVRGDHCGSTIRDRRRERHEGVRP